MALVNLLHDTNDYLPGAADTTPGAAGTSTGTGGTLIDVQGGVAQFAAQQLQLTAEGSNEFLRDVVVFPASGSFSQIPQRVVADIPLNAATGTPCFDLVLRFQIGKSFYLPVWNGSGSGALELYKVLGGSSVSQISSAASAPLYNPAKTYQLEGIAVPGTQAGLTALSFNLYETTSGTPVLISSKTATDGETSLQNAGTAGLNIHSNPPSANVKARYSRLRYYTEGTEPLAAPAPTIGAISSTSIQVVAGPTGGTAPYQIQQQRAPDNNNTPGTPANIGPNTSATTLSHGSLTAGVKYWFRYIVTDANGTSVTSAWVSATTSASPAVVVSATDANFYNSPYNHYVVGANQVAPTNPGAYRKIKVSNTTTVKIGVDVSAFAGAPSARFPVVSYQVDGGMVQRVLLTAGQTSIDIAGLGTGTHTIQYMWTGNYVFGTSWSPTLLWTGLTLDAGGVVSAPAIKSKRMVSFGDSITKAESCRETSSDFSYDSINTDAFVSYVWKIAERFDCEVGIIAYGGWGWEANSAGGVPRFDQSWDKYFNNVSRLSGGLLSPAPDYATNNHGANGGVSANTVQAWLTAFRAAAGANCKLLEIIPFGGFNRSAITNGVNSYKTASGDVNTFLIDLGTEYQTGIDNNPPNTTSAQSPDRLHPNVATHAVLGTAAADAIELVLGAVPDPDPTITSVTISPADPPDLAAGETLQLSAAVAGTGDYDDSVTWTRVSGVGTVSSTGLYTAPSGESSSDRSAVVKATSVADPTKSDTVTINIPGVPVEPPPVDAFVQTIPLGRGYVSQAIPLTAGTGPVYLSYYADMYLPRGANAELTMRRGDDSYSFQGKVISAPEGLIEVLVGEIPDAGDYRIQLEVGGVAYPQGWAIPATVAPNLEVV